jgi:hypothetical protein
MILLKGKGQTTGQIPLGLAAARTYFEDLPAFLGKIEAVDSVKPLTRPGAYLVIHHPMGAMSYQVAMVACLQAEWHAGGMRLSPLDFDLDKVASPHETVKGFVEGELKLIERHDALTAAEFGFSVSIELPIPPVLSLVPRPMIQATGDGIMNLQTGLIVQSLFRKVMDDFALTAAQ